MFQKEMSATAQQRMKIANEKAMKNVTQRGNVPKSTKADQDKYPVIIINSSFFSNEFFTGWALVACSVHLCSVWISCLSDHTEHTNGIIYF